ncbi:MAG: M20/M25/M40 family metallo-hydrolase [bacterium]|nr:MAG: M20/M25/M40 family metallo-hydrolase [bacterium]
MKIKNCLLSILIFLTFFYTPSTSLISQEKPDGEAAKSYVAYLASDALEGRDTGTPGYEKATKWVAEKFKSWGLEPAGENDTYFQKFPFKFHKDEFDYPKLIIGNRTFYFEDQDFNVLRYSGGGKVKGEVVFAGFGISALDKGLDEYAGLDVKNKIVLVMHGCPEDDEEKWEGFHTDSAKAAIAMKKGAVGLLICANFGEEDRGISRWRLRPGNYQENFLAFGVDERVVKFLLKKKAETSRMFQRRLQDQFNKLNKSLEPMSVATEMEAKMEVKIEYDPERQGLNVLGMIKGTDSQLGEEVIVLGAHLDHRGILYGQVYNGADDNATGSAVVMEAARVMIANKVKPKRTILFACWGGEERGLLGSRYYAEHPIIPIEKTVMNFNMDMVGIGNKLNFPGIYYAPKIWAIIKENTSEEILDFIEPSRGGPGGSDHTPFITRGVPAFALMTTPWRAHTDYHQPGDDTENIDAELLGKVAQFVYDNALLIANHEGDLIVENRLPIYIHKSANIVNIHPTAYEPGIPLLDSLQNEWIDIQFVEVSLDSLKDTSARLAAMVKSLDAASEEESNITRMMGPMARMFRSRRDQTNSVVGLKGISSVNNDLANLRIAGKLGAKFFVIDSLDANWVTEEKGLTIDGKKAIKEMNDQKMLILLQNLPENAVYQILDVSKHPVVIAGVKAVDTISDSLIQKVEENSGLLALAFCPDKIDKLVERVEALKQRTEITHIGLYPCPEKDLDIDNLDQMLNLTIALNQKGYEDREIKNILGENFQTIFEKISPRDQRRMRRPF